MKYEELKNVFYGGLVSFSCQVSFVIGGPEGLPELPSDLQRISLSPLSLPHRLARVVLLEQVFRAREIWAGGKYHTDG